MRKTCPKNEYLILDIMIMKLADLILNKKEIEKAERISLMLTESKKKKELAINELLRILPIRPKRPLSYCHHELTFLPAHTRNSMRYLGDYIDFLIKMKTYDVTKNHGNQTKSLGINIKYLKCEFDTEFIEILSLFNNVYVNAKHNFNVNKRKHFFSPKDVVFTVFVVVKIAKKLIESSELVKQCSEDKAKNVY